MMNDRGYQCAVEEVSRTATRVLSNRRPHAKEDEREVVEPGPRPGGCRTGHDALLQSPMLTLDESVALRMVLGCLATGNPQKRRELGPEAASKLPPAVSDNGRRDSKSGHPMTQQGEGAVLGCDRGQGLSLIHI